MHCLPGGDETQVGPRQTFVSGWVLLESTANPAQPPGRQKRPAPPGLPCSARTFQAWTKFPIAVPGRQRDP